VDESLELDDAERLLLREALISAFPSSGSLNMVTSFHLGRPLGQIVTPGALDQQVGELITWTEASDKTPSLIKGARIENDGNKKLRDFEARYQTRRQSVRIDSSGKGKQPDKGITSNLRTQLVAVLNNIPVTSSYSGRNALLAGIPGNLNRNADNAFADLSGIIDQLDKLGRLQTGQWSLLVLIDNALPFVQGYQEPTATLQSVRQALAHIYGGV